MIAGIDEAGRGPLAGPVVAAVVVLSKRRVVHGIDDSKVLSAGRRADLAVEIRAKAVAYGVGWADAAEVDAINILQATFLAMRRALLAMPYTPSRLLVDGNRLPSLQGFGFAGDARAIIRGDARRRCIGAASILAKTTRDHFMNQAHELYPSYQFCDHKGYATADHRRLLALHGPCPLHRRSFNDDANFAP